MRRNRKQQSNQSTQICQMHARSIVSHPSKYQIWYTKTTSGTITYSPYIYTSHSYDQGFHNVLNGVSLPAAKHKRQIYNHFWTLRASTHELPPCVLRHTGNAYVVFHIFTHTLPSTIEMAPKRSTLNGQRCICYRGNVFTSRTNRLMGQPRVNVSQGTRSWPIA